MENEITDRFEDPLGISAEGRAKVELCRQADAILARTGLTIWGRKDTEEEYKQNRFEHAMQLGAYSRNGANR